jgi:hypothetical protein
VKRNHGVNRETKTFQGGVMRIPVGLVLAALKPNAEVQRGHLGIALNGESMKVKVSKVILHCMCVAVLVLGVGLSNALGQAADLQPDTDESPIACPSFDRDSNGEGLGVTCSQSLMDRKETSDNYGSRIAKMYLAVQVNVRNTSQDHEYHLHDIVLKYRNVRISGRDKKLVRNVAEKGQSLDRRNMVLSLMGATASVAGGLVGLPLVGPDFKNYTAFFSGPLTQATKQALPDFTIPQVDRVNDSAFGVETIVVPKGASTVVVTFLSQAIFLNKDEQQEFRKAKSIDPEALLKFQKGLEIEIVGEHVAHVANSQASVADAHFEINANKDGGTLWLVGTNLDRVQGARLSANGGSPISANLTLVNGSPKWARVDIDKSPAAGSTYTLSLLTRGGKEVPTNCSVAMAGTVDSASLATKAQVVTPGFPHGLQ